MEKEHYKGIILNANNYKYAVKVLEDRINNPQIGDCLDEYVNLVFPIIVWGSLVCEMYLKALVYENTGELKEGHNLEQLFDFIKEEDKIWCRDEFNKLHNNKNFDDELKSIKCAFTNWRYVYERGWTKEEDYNGISADSVTNIMNLLSQLCKKYKN